MPGRHWRPRDRNRFGAILTFGPLYLAWKSPRVRWQANEGRPVFRAFGWRVFAGVL